MSAKFQLINDSDMWKEEVQKIKARRKDITVRSFSQLDGLLTIKYDFSDGSYVKIPVEVMERFLIN